MNTVSSHDLSTAQVRRPKLGRLAVDVLRGFLMASVPLAVFEVAFKVRHSVSESLALAG